MFPCIALLPNSLQTDPYGSYVIAYSKKTPKSVEKSVENIVSKLPEGLARIIQNMNPKLGASQLTLTPNRTIRIFDQTSEDPQWIDMPYHRHLWYRDIIEFLDYYWITIKESQFISKEGFLRWAEDRVDSNVKSILLTRNEFGFVIRIQ